VDPKTNTNRETSAYPDFGKPLCRTLGRFKKNHPDSHYMRGHLSFSLFVVLKNCFVELQKQYELLKEVGNSCLWYNKQIKEGVKMNMPRN